MTGVSESIAQSLSSTAPASDGVITNRSHVGETIKKIIEYLNENGFSDEASNIERYLEEGKFIIDSTIDPTVNGFTILGSDGPIHLNPNKLPHPPRQWSFDNPIRSTDILRMMMTLLHEKYHAEEQGIVDYLWYPIMWIYTLFNPFAEEEYNPIETEAWKHTVGFADKLIDVKINECRRMMDRIPQHEWTMHSHEFKMCLEKIYELIMLKEYLVQSHNHWYSPTINGDKISETRVKLADVLSDWPMDIHGLRSILGQIEAKLIEFEFEMNNF